MLAAPVAVAVPRDADKCADLPWCADAGVARARRDQDRRHKARTMHEGNGTSHQLETANGEQR